jgi:glycosyltransferase involved in cell wall biosynthesis
MTISIWHNFVPPPWGGGNQFLLALKNKMSKNNVALQENIIDKDTNCCLINAISFDVAKFKKEHNVFRPKVIHRVDGPVFLIRGFDKEKDDICFSLNNEYVSATIVQSKWMFNKISEMGYVLKNPVIVYNAANPEIFNRNNKIEFSIDRKIKIISASWSNNPRKGRDIYKWLDNNLDWNRFEYTFVGNIDAKFKNIKVIGPVDSIKLANIIKQHDIYITASKNDPCSNSLIEALSCGLPSIFFNDGGHPEIVGQGGLPFEDVSKIPMQLNKIINNYTSFQNAIKINDMDFVYNKYMELL